MTPIVGMNDLKVVKIVLLGLFVESFGLLRFYAIKDRTLQQRDSLLEFNISAPLSVLRCSYS